MPVDPGVALASVFTSAGAPIWGGIIQALIQVLKGVPQFKAIIDGREKLLCFIFSGIFVGLAFYAGITALPPALSLDVIGIVAALLSWFTVARLSMTAYDDFIAKLPEDKPAPKAGERPSQSVLSTTGWNGATASK